MTKVITHNGVFHQDDLFAVSTLFLLFEDLELIRTRDENIISNGDFIVDVGGENIPEANRFDHHQTEGAGKRENGVPYASFGLVWKKYGLMLCNNDEKVWDIVDKKLVQPIDAYDCGYELFTLKSEKVYPFLFDNALKSLMPTWHDTDKTVDQLFVDLIPFIQQIILGEIKKAHYFFEDIVFVKEAYKNAKDKRIIILDNPLPWKSILTKKPEPLYVIHPDNITGDWVLFCVKISPKSLTSKKPLPESWAGKVGEEFENISGVKDALFCHKNLFMAKAKTKEAAIKLAEISLAS